MTTVTQMASKVTMVKQLQHLAAIGELTPHRVVEDARDPVSPLHDEFDWDIEAAAQQHWEQQARKLIDRFCVYVRTTAYGDQVPVQVFIRDPDAAPTAQGYVVVATMTAASAKDALSNELACIAGHIRRGWGLAVQWKLRREFLRGLAQIREELK